MIPESALADLSILNCNDGDIRVSFDDSDPLELARAQRIVEDMLRRGYILFVDEGDGKLKRVLNFNKKRNSYIIADRGTDESDEEQTAEETEPKPRAKGKKKTREVPAKRGRAIAVGRTAGG